ncbi:Integrator complex subunit 6 [Geranomyces michiganensis]|nr:Integrator complex subunit 6 [Geranomyces michiganensis]
MNGSSPSSAGPPGTSMVKRAHASTQQNPNLRKRRRTASDSEETRGRQSHRLAAAAAAAAVHTKNCLRDSNAGSRRPASVQTLALSINIEEAHASLTAKVSLQDANLWAQFESVGNEMIMTKNGRCLFPTLRFNLSGLEPKSYYSVAVDIVQADRSRFKFVREGKWIPVDGSAKSTHQNEFDRTESTAAFVNDKGVQTGAFWEKNGAGFTKLKITNTPLDGFADDKHGGLFSLQSFHQYQPRVHLIKHRPGHRQVNTFTFPETKFIAVTHYQNKKVNSLKKNYNPHAKGFKDTESKLIASRIRASNPVATSKTGNFMEAACRTTHSRAPALTGTTARDRDHIVPSVRTPLRQKAKSRRALQHSVDDLYDYSESTHSESDYSGATASSPDSDSDADLLHDFNEAQRSYDSEQDAIGSDDDSQDYVRDFHAWEPTALDMLASFCSHILQSGKLDQDPEMLAGPLLPIPVPRSTYAPHAERHGFDSLVLAYLCGFMIVGLRTSGVGRSQSETLTVDSAHPPHAYPDFKDRFHARPLPADAIMIFVFVVDTSASMNRMFSHNLSYIESAKSGIEHFFKWEHASSNRANNKYMLVTYEEHCYKTLLDTDDDQALLQELKLLQATDMSTAGATFGKMFEYLDLYRRTRNFDTIGRGRYPAEAETTTIFWFTDGSHFAEKNADKFTLSNELHIPQLQTPGHELYIEPFRWDQRLFTLWMTQTVPPDSTVPQMSSVMRGEWWQIPTLRYLWQCIDNSNANRAIAPPETIMIYCNKSSTRHFPIPEAYWADNIAPSADGAHGIPPRTAHPTILYTKRDDIYPIPEGFPVDRFSIDQRSELVQELRKQKEKISWTFSGPNADIGAPFGTLKYSESSKTVSMYLMPYNFPVLFGHIMELRKRGTASSAAQSIGEYLRSVPIYYREPLHKAFFQINQLHLWPRDVMPIPNAHIETVSTDASRAAKTMMPGIKNEVLARRAEHRNAALRQKIIPGPIPVTSLFQSALDIPRSKLTDAIRDLRAAFVNMVPSSAFNGRPRPPLQPGIQRQSPDDEPRHNRPIGQMGYYAERMAKQQRLRDPLEDEETARQRDRNVFGNPYRQDKKVSIDEEDEAAQLETGSLASRTASSSSSGTRRKRKLPPSAAGSDTSELSAFNRTKVPALTGGRLRPLLDMPPAIEWAEIVAARESEEGSKVLAAKNAKRIALLAAYQPVAVVVAEVETAALKTEQPPVQQMAVDASSGRAPLTQLEIQSGQDNVVDLSREVSVIPISPDTPSEILWDGNIEALRANIRKMVWCVPKDYKPEILINHLTQLNVEARRAILPYALHCASTCRKRALVENIRALESSLSVDADISMPPERDDARRVDVGRYG